MNISYKDHDTNEEVRRKIQTAIGKLSDWPHLKIFCLSKDDPAGHTARKKEEKVDRRSGSGKAGVRSGQGWTLRAQLGQLRTELGGKGFCKVICGAPTTSQGYGVDKTRDYKKLSR